jgi:predicted DNA-binding transcriptional regulator YafY
MADSEIPRLSRLTAMITLLQTRKLITATEISKKYNISIRTVYRDIKALEEAGIPICTEEGKGYFLMEGFRLPPVMFTEKEANALITAQQLVSKNKDASFIEDFSEAINKIKSVLRNKTKDKADLLSNRIVFRQNIENKRTSSYLSQFQMALTNFNLVEIQYHVPDKNETTSRILEPFALYSTQENWLLIAWCLLRKDYRTFRLDRIISLQVKEQYFEPHKISLQEYFEICKEKNSNP